MICIYKTQQLFLPSYVFYAFPARSSDCDEIWYRDRLDLDQEDRLHFVAKNVNKKSNLGKFSNSDFEIYGGNFCL